MVWKPVISDVGIKLVASSGWALPEIKVANTLVNQWEELTFNFSSYPNPPATEGQYDQIVILPDFNMAGRTQDNVIYFDNITFNQLVGVNNPAVQDRVVIYPNPVKAGRQVMVGSEVQRIELLDMGGKVISSTRASVIETSSLKQGMYILRILTIGGDIQTQKLVVH